MLQNKVALVTGASRGIGARTAVELAKAGCQVAVNYHRSAAQSHRVLQEIWDVGGTAAAFQGDVSDPESCRSMVEQVIQTFGTIHILVNNAGINGHMPFLETSLEFAQRLYQVNCMSVVYMDHLVIPYMARQHWGRVVTVTSVGGLMGFSGNAEYSGSKAAAHGRAKAIAREMGPYNITYNIVAPGCTRTDMVAAAAPDDVERTRLATPLQRLIEPQEIAAAVLYLVQADSVTGQILSPNAGLYI